jgi:Flp pilus assembly pilin Flp
MSTLAGWIAVVLLALIVFLLMGIVDRLGKIAEALGGKTGKTSNRRGCNNDG